MSYVALYRKYRPNNFSSVVGQEVIVQVLINAIKTNHISHAYLFTGPRGTGKTSIAKIFAKAVNCLDFQNDICDKCNICQELKQNDSDIVEIDAASNNGVDEIRTLRDNVKLMPSICKYKIYIIDEVHMLSTGAFNALLKTLEEPPTHVIFILATTEPNKIPATILSRCQRFDFNKVDSEKVYNRLTYILENENTTLNDEVTKYIAENTEGCLRDAVNLLDQTISLNKGDKTTIEDVDKLSGKISDETTFNILNTIIEGNYEKLLSLTKELCEKGTVLTDLVNKLLTKLRDISINNQVKYYFDEDYKNKLSKFNLKTDIIIEITKSLNELLNELKYSNNQQILFEIYMMNLINLVSENSSKKENNHNTSITEEKYEIKVNNQLNEKNEKNEEVKEENIQQIEENENHIEDKKAPDLEELKKIRINNALAKASKEILNNLINNYDKINDYFSNKKYNTIVELLNNAKIVVASDENLILSFKNASDVIILDKNYRQIEIFLQEIYEKEYKIVAISDEEWLKIKEEYIKNKKNNISYVIIDENVVKLKRNENSESKTEEELESSAADIFGENVVSIK